MRLISLDLENVGPHRKLHWEFGSGVIGIFGPNGSGKSNAINIGCYAALTNDYGRGVGGQEGQICQQKKADEISQIVLKGQQASTVFEITRILYPKVKHKMVVGGKELHSARDIQQELENILDIKRQLLDDYVFVPQWELINFFRLTPAARAKSFAYVCRTIRAEKLYDAIGNELNLARPMAETVTDNRDDIRRQIGEYQDRQLLSQVQLDTASEGLMNADDLARCQEIIKRQERRARLLEALTGRQNDVKIKLSLARDATAAAKAAVEQVTIWEPHLVEAQEKAAEAKQRQAVWTVERKRRQDFLACKREYDTLRAKVIKEPVTDIEETTEELRKQQQQLVLAIQPHSDLVNRFDDLEDGATATCHTCGQSLTDVLVRVAQARSALTPLQLELTKVLSLLVLRDTYDKASVKWAGDLGTKNRQLITLQERLEAFGEVPDPQRLDEDECSRIFDDLQNMDQRLQLIRGAARSAELKKADHIARHKAAKAELEAAELKIQELSIPAAEYGEADRRLEAHKAAELDVREHETRVSEWGGFISQWQKELKRVTLTLKRTKKARRYLKLLSRVRQVVHRDNLPYKVHQRALLRMEDGINETLEQFDSPFRVTTEEGLSYVAHFPNGTVKPAEGLSGGQQVVLALALRWALNSLFANQIGMMILDEPTAGLDQRNLDCLESALVGLSEVARSRGYQLIMITHEQRLERVFDQVITLDRIQ